MDNVEKDLKRAGLTLYGITTGRNRVRLEELVGDRERWKDITAASMAGRAYRMITDPDRHSLKPKQLAIKATTHCRLYWRLAVASQGSKSRHLPDAEIDLDFRPVLNLNSVKLAQNRDRNQRAAMPPAGLHVHN